MEDIAPLPDGWASLGVYTSREGALRRVADLDARFGIGAHLRARGTVTRWVHLRAVVVPTAELPEGTSVQAAACPSVLTARR